MSLKEVKKNPAFTLVELLVSIAILLVLLAVVFANFRETKKRQELEYQTEKVLIVINKAQNLALTGQKIADGSVPYYGLHVKDNQDFIIYTDSQPRAYAEGKELPGNTFDLGEKIQITAEAGDLLFQPSTGGLYDSAGSRVTQEFKAFTVYEAAEPTNDKEIWINGQASRVVRVE